MTAAGMLALPEDPDLDYAVTSLTVTSVVTTETQELLVRLDGGTGWWQGDRHSDAVECNVSGYFPDSPPDLFAAFAARLTRWRDSGVPIRICGAPGRMTLLIDDAGAFVPFPRCDHPRLDSRVTAMTTRPATKRAICDDLLTMFNAATTMRDQRRHFVTGLDGTPELGWVQFERDLMHEMTNRYRADAGLADVPIEEIAAVEQLAAGHSDYALKFALYCAEIAVGERPR